MTHHESHAAENHAPGGMGKYITVAVLLLFLTGISFGAYELLHDKPAVAWTVMMAVSCSKAMLVILFFMHLKWEANWKYVLTFPATFMALFLGFMLIWDIGLRTHHYSEERWKRAAVPVSATPQTESHAAPSEGWSESHWAAYPGTSRSGMTEL